MFEFIFIFVSQLSSDLLPKVEVDSMKSDWSRHAVARRSLLRFSSSADEVCALASQTRNQIEGRFGCGRVFFKEHFLRRFDWSRSSLPMPGWTRVTWKRLVQVWHRWNCCMTQLCCTTMGQHGRRSIWIASSLFGPLASCILARKSRSLSGRAS